MSLEDLAAHPREPVEARLGSAVRELWLERVALHFDDSYAGIPMTKFPEDLRVYEHLLWAVCPSAVVEVGVHHGGSALWFRDRLRTLEGYGRVTAPRFIGVDVDLAAARANLAALDPRWQDHILLLEGDIREPSMATRVRDAVAPGASCLVIDDSAHEYDTTIATLDGLSALVLPGDFLVVEDGCVDIDAMRMESTWPRGVLPAVRDWLGSAAGSAFVRRRDLELYGITCHPGGFLQRRPSAT
jgi:cephalosporin hydroxylase